MSNNIRVIVIVFILSNDIIYFIVWIQTLVVLELEINCSVSYCIILYLYLYCIVLRLMCASVISPVHSGRPCELNRVGSQRSASLQQSARRMRCRCGSCQVSWLASSALWKMVREAGGADGPATSTAAKSPATRTNALWWWLQWTACRACFLLE